MRKHFVLLPLLGCFFACGNGGDNTGQPDSGPDATSAADATAEAQADVSLPTGATLAVGPSFVWVLQNAQTQEQTAAKLLAP